MPSRPRKPVGSAHSPSYRRFLIPRGDGNVATAQALWPRAGATGRQMAGEASEAVAHRPRAPDPLGGTRRSLGTVRTPGVLGDAPADIVVVESASVAARGHFAASRPRTRAGAAGERRPPPEPWTRTTRAPGALGGAPDGAGVDGPATGAGGGPV